MDECEATYAAHEAANQVRLNYPTGNRLGGTGKSLVLLMQEETRKRSPTKKILPAEITGVCGKPAYTCVASFRCRKDPTDCPFDE